MVALTSAALENWRGVREKEKRLEVGRTTFVVEQKWRPTAEWGRSQRRWLGWQC